MLWNFYPVKEFETLSVRGSMQWQDEEVEAELTVLGADPERPLRAYAVRGEEQYYLGLLRPGEDGMRLTVKRTCPKCDKLFLCIGRAEEAHTVVATGTSPETEELQTVIDDAPKQKADPREENPWQQLCWEKKQEPEEETDAQQFLFSHPSTQANIQFYDHYCKTTRDGEIIYAFASSFGPHPLPHLAKYSCWHDIDLGFGHKGYFIIGLKGQEFVLPE